LSLIELVVVLSLLVALGGLAIRLGSPVREAANEQATRANLAVIRDAIVQHWSDTKLIGFDGGATTEAAETNRFHLRWLFRNPIDGSSMMTPTYPEQQIGWNGPYLLAPTGTYTVDATRGFTTDYGTAGDPTVLDSFPVRVGNNTQPGSPIIVQDVNPALSIRDIRIVSAGANGVIDTPPDATTDSLTIDEVGDDIFVALQLQ